MDADDIGSVHDKVSPIQILFLPLIGPDLDWFLLLLVPAYLIAYISGHLFGLKFFGNYILSYPIRYLSRKKPSATFLLKSSLLVMLALGFLEGIFRIWSSLIFGLYHMLLNLLALGMSKLHYLEGYSHRVQFLAHVQILEDSRYQYCTVMILFGLISGALANSQNSENSPP